MHSGKKITKEDTWRPDDLKRYIRVEEHDDYGRRQDVIERRHRAGESKERRPRDPEKESRRERDKHEEQESTRDRRAEDKKDRYVDKRKEGSRDRRGDKEQDGRDRERRRDREQRVDINKYNDDYREVRDSRGDREEKHDRERDKERRRDKEKERVRNRERYREGGRDKRREERDKERQKEESGREHRTERWRHEESGELGGDRTEKYDRQRRDRHWERDRHKDRSEEKTNEKERRERHGARKHSEGMGQREYKEEHKKPKEERERRHKDREHEEKRKHDGESREHRDSKRSVEEVKHHLGDGERAERDKQKERRHREEEALERKQRERRQREEGQEPEGNHRDRTSSKKTISSDKSNMHETKAVETEVALGEDLDEQEYEDDFEDYEEDFEEMDESENEGGDEKETELSQVEEREELTPQRRKEIEAIQRAMEEENERVGTAQHRQSVSREEEDEFKRSKAPEKDQSTGSQRGKFIDFVAAKQREISKKVATKQKKRSTELLRLIDLDFSMTFSLLDLPPVNEYDMYIRNFGKANTKQAYVQCNEDNAERDIQTEEIEMCEKWTQHPPEGSGACGDPYLSHGAQDKIISELNFDSKRLTAFLSSASQVMVVLLEEDQAERKSLRKLGTQTDMLSFSTGRLQLNTKLPFLSGRNIHLVHFSQVQRHIMMSVHAPTTQPSAAHLDSCTIICIWNIWEPSRPQKILVYESEIQCCCFSTGKAILVFAGTSVGSVVLWDLREPANNHNSIKIGEDEWTFRQPTFSTDAVMADSGHLSAVTSVEVVSSSAAGELTSEVPLAASEEELSGLSFQLASLDESGVLNFWVVVDLPKANEAGSPTDLGLRPGSKVKLLYSSSLLTVDRVSPQDPVKTGPLQTVHLKFHPTDSNHFFIGTNMGLVNHGTSHGLKAPPKFYRLQVPGTRPVDITSIQFSPFKQNLFLVGCGDGSIRLHAVSHEQPVAEWKSSTAGEPVMLLQWGQTRPTVFCVLDAASTLHIWDLLKSETEPVVTERIAVDRVTAMAVFGDSRQKNVFSGVALAHESGKLEMHYFTRDFTVPIDAEGEKLESIMTDAL